MRVIEMGKLPEKEVVCEHCNSTLAYTEADVDYKSEEVFGEWHSHSHVICPVCGFKIVLTVDGDPVVATVKE